VVARQHCVCSLFTNFIGFLFRNFGLLVQLARDFSKSRVHVVCVKETEKLNRHSQYKSYNYRRTMKDDVVAKDFVFQIKFMWIIIYNITIIIHHNYYNIIIIMLSCV
jgi:hypothetical protein